MNGSLPQTPAAIANFLQHLNQDYLKVHLEKEDAFWAAKMGLAGTDANAFPVREKAWQAFVSEAERLPSLRAAAAIPGLRNEDVTSLRGWIRFFESHAMENPEARTLLSGIVDQEARLQAARGSLDLAYADPATGEKIPASSVKLGLLIRNAPEEGLRRAAYAGLKDIEQHVLAHGFLDIVRARNRLARLLGYEDYYDFKVWRNEGFSKRRLFEVLEDLEESTRESAQASVAALEKQHGAAARRGYNFAYLTAGDVTKKLDPYFDFGSALLRWGRSFAGLGIRYGGATLVLDLLDRKGKYENGFMHGPVSAWVDQGAFKPARIQFTANAIPGQVGSGQRATETLFHEGGHAAHFSNVRMPAPCFAQEYAPTSVAFAETQSMFLDRLIDTPEWLARYALDRRGNSIPTELVLESLRLKHPTRAFQLRAMLTVCFAERALYEMSDAALTPENVLRTFGDIEREIQFLEQGVRPVLSVPHLLAWESSAYYHGYVLAEMAVNQTRRYFLNNNGFLVDNPKVGKELRENYWKPGNSKTFFELIEGMTGEPFSAAATVEEVGQPLPEAEAAARNDLAKAAGSKGYQGPVDLEAHIRVAHGDEEVAGNSAGEPFEKVAERFSDWIETQSAARH